jgi:hypothetical protein
MRRAAERKLSTMKENEGKADDEKINVRSADIFFRASY